MHDVALTTSPAIRRSRGYVSGSYPNCAATDCRRMRGCAPYTFADAGTEPEPPASSRLKWTAALLAEAGARSEPLRYVHVLAGIAIVLPLVVDRYVPDESCQLAAIRARIAVSEYIQPLAKYVRPG